MLSSVERETSMGVKLVLGVVCVLGLAGCSPEAPKVETPKAEAPVVAPQEQASVPAEPLDPFVVMVGAERWTVILERGLDGAREAPDPAEAAERTDMYRADAALKRGAAMVIELRNDVCGKSLVTGAACTLPEWPAWTRELPTGDTPIAEIDKRSDWLSSVMSPFTDAACEAGRTATKDDMFCSVE
jgi:hypothetical protein